jgi:hypothetical protein
VALDRAIEVIGIWAGFIYIGEVNEAQQSASEATPRPAQAQCQVSLNLVSAAEAHAEDYIKLVAERVCCGPQAATVLTWSR